MMTRLWVFGLSWLLITVYVLAGGSIYNPWYPLVGTLYMWVPGCVALWVRRKQATPFPILGNIRKLLPIAIGIPLLYASCAALVSTPYMDLRVFDPMLEALNIESPPTPIQWFVFAASILTPTILAGCTVNAVAALGEELYWRGLLFDQVAHKVWWQRDLTIGALWGLWHAPLVMMGHNYPEHRILGVLMMMLWCISAAPVFSWLRIRSKGTVIPAVCHGMINASAILIQITLPKISWIYLGMVGATGIAVWLLFDAFLWWRGELKYGDAYAHDSDRH